MASLSLARLGDEVTLRRDGRRVAIEGVLTGGGLAVLLLYMFKGGSAAFARPSDGGDVALAGPVAFGPFRGSAGRILIAPLQAFAVPPVEMRRLGSGGGDGGGGGGSPVPSGGPPPSIGAEPVAEFSLPPAAAAFTGADVVPSSPSGPSPYIPPGPGPTPPEPPVPPEPPKPPGPNPDPLEQLVLVIVQTSSSSGARSVFGDATSDTDSSQIAVRGSRIYYQSNRPQAAQWSSERLVPSFASSRFNDATLFVNAEHTNFQGSSLKSGAGTDYLVFNTADLLPVGVTSSGDAKADLSDVVIVLDRSSVDTGAGDEAVVLESVLNLLFSGLGESTSADLNFDFSTLGMKDSELLVGSGINTVTINSGYYRTKQQGQSLESGLRLELDDAPVMKDLSLPWQFQLTADAIGVQNSRIVFGDGNDDLTIFTRIDGNLRDALGARYNDPGTQIELRRIGLLDSTVKMGGGDDRLRVNGDVINSTIDLGDGVNQLILEKPLKGDSKIILGDGDSNLEISGLLGGKVQGGPGNNTFVVQDLVLAGELNGGGGNDLLISSSEADASRDVLHVTGPNQGFLNGLRFEAINNLDLGGSNDVAIVGFDSSLSGILLGGAGLDRLTFRDWQTPVSVDLDLGQASPIFGGAPGGFQGFEYASGGQKNDLMASSTSFLGLDGGPGDDTLVLRWTPWASRWTGSDHLEVLGGPGRDLVVLSMLDSQPDSWDKVSGIPDLVELNLNNSAISDQLGWLRSPGEAPLSLTPSGLDGLGQVTMLPIAPLEQLLSGMNPAISQLAVNTQPLLDQQGSAELVLLGRGDGSRAYQVVAHLPQVALGVYTPAA